MKGKPLLPNPRSHENKATPPTVENLLSRGEFEPCSHAALEALWAPISVGDLVQVRRVGRFAVVVHISVWADSRSYVMVGTYGEGDVKWGEPKAHTEPIHAALDAYRLVSAFGCVSVGGD